MVIVGFVGLRLFCGCADFVVLLLVFDLCLRGVLYCYWLVDCVVAVSVFNLLCFYSGCVVCALVVFGLGMGLTRVVLVVCWWLCAGLGIRWSVMRLVWLHGCCASELFC